MDLGCRYAYNKPGCHSAYKAITLDIFNEKSPFSGRVELLAELQEQGKQIHGHSVLCKRAKFPRSSLSELLGYVEVKVAHVAGVHSWDVLNEILGIIPANWILAVLEKMRKLQPDSLLFWNEYALKNRRYWDEVIELAAISKTKGLLDGIGIQRHIDLRGKMHVTAMARPFASVQSHLKSSVADRRLEHEIDRIHELGLLCHISEVSIECFPWQTANAQKLLDRLMAIAEKKDVWRFTTWTHPVIKEIAL
ncbi:MAG: endo-1,4-beta-xylanase [Cyanobacteria bacterium P01_D01_bin.56]